jgi:vacuolar-type H+-ATPase subunit E/Vma4
MPIELSIHAVEQATGQSIEFIRDTSLEELRRIEEEKRGRPLVFTSASREEIESEFENAIKHLPREPENV